MASAASAHSSATATLDPTLPIPDIPVSADIAAVGAVPARQEVRMGRAAAAGMGINWLTLGVMVAFHIGALAALFFFNWQRLVVAVVLYVVAINVGIGMCYPFVAAALWMDKAEIPTL